MTATTPTAAPSEQPAIDASVTPRFSDTIRSEWTKFRSVRSTPISLLVTIALAIGVGALISYERASHYRPPWHGWDPTVTSLRGIMIAQLAICVLGVLVITAEYSTGMIRTSLAAVPRRPPFLAAKVVVFTVVAVVIGEVVSFIAFLVGQSLISGQHGPTASLASGASLRAVVGAGLYLAVLGIIAIAAGAIFRSTAAAISAVVAMLYVLPGLVQALPSSWAQPLSKYWPTEAGSQVFTVVRDSHTLSAWAGFADMCIFAAVVLGIGFYLLKRRDA